MRFTLPPIPSQLEFLNTPADWRVIGDDLVIRASERTDWFYPPDGTLKSDNAPVALFTPNADDVTLSARVQVNFQSTYDAGVLHIHRGKDLWGKLCFEYSPQGEPMVVSVVTRGVSDDCNSVPIAGYQVFLRIARVGNTFAFHYSLDGSYWHFVRYFALGTFETVHVGFSAQSPTGQGCEARLSQIEYKEVKLTDLRNGE